MNTVPLRYLIKLNARVLPESTQDDFKFRYIDIAQVTADGDVRIAEELTRFAEAPSRARRLADPGDTVVSTVRTYLKAIAEVPICPDPLVFSTGFAVLTPTSIYSRFLAYACCASNFIAEVVSRSTGVSYPAINPSDLLDIRLHAPDGDQQRRIAEFLDDRVTRIDRIIAARREQIAKVEGVGEARMQDLHDELLTRHGEVRLGHVLTGLEQGWSPQADSTPAGPHEWGVMRSGCVNGGTFRAEDNKRLPDGVDPRTEYEIRSGDLLMSRASGSLDLIGSVAVVPADVRSCLLLCDKIYRIFPQDEWRADYLACIMRTRRSRERIRLGVSGAEGMANNLPSGVVRDLRIPLVPKERQTEVVRRAEMIVRGVATVTAGLNHSIELLRECKSSLIAAAVTGEIDVTAGSGIPG